NASSISRGERCSRSAYRKPSFSASEKGAAFEIFQTVDLVLPCALLFGGQRVRLDAVLEVVQQAHPDRDQFFVPAPGSAPSPTIGFRKAAKPWAIAGICAMVLNMLGTTPRSARRAS